MRISFETVGAAPADVLVRVVGPGAGAGEVRRLSELQVPPATPRTVVWDGLTAAGLPVPDGEYRVLVGQAGSPEQQAGRVSLLGHFYPVRGRHGVRGGVGMFGAGRNGGRIHEGFDVTAGCGTPLAAVRTGTVIRKGYDPVLYGNFIEMRGLGEQVTYFFAHMPKPTPYAKGDHVQTGAIVGRVGITGNAAGTPCHLHIQIKSKGRLVDPRPLLKRWDKVS